MGQVGLDLGLGLAIWIGMTLNLSLDNAEGSRGFNSSSREE